MNKIMIGNEHSYRGKVGKSFGVSKTCSNIRCPIPKIHTVQTGFTFFRQDRYVFMRCAKISSENCNLTSELWVLHYSHSRKSLPPDIIRKVRTCFEFYSSVNNVGYLLKCDALWTWENLLRSIREIFEEPYGQLSGKILVFGLILY